MHQLFVISITKGDEPKNMKIKYKTMLKGIASFVLILLIISVVTFLLVKMQPGDPAANYLRAMHVGINNETLTNARKILNLDKPLYEQYGLWLNDVLHGNLGISYTQKRPVAEIIMAATVPTFQLGIVAFIILFFLSSFIGVVSALNHGKVVDYIMQGLSFVSVSVPTFWLGYMLIIFFSITHKILPASGRGGFENYILPAICLMIPLVGQTGLFIRKTMLEQMGKAHVENAILRGVKKRYVVLNHLIRNIAIPSLTVFSANIMYLISGSILIEEVFSWPGLGRMFVAAVRGSDLPLIQGSLLFFGIMAIVLNSGTQRIVYYLEPHMRVGRK